MASTIPLAKPPTFGTSIPERPHAVSVHLPKWEDVVDVALGKPRVKGVLKGGYPRSFIHESIVAVHQAVLKRYGNETQIALVFPARQHVDACKTYLCTPPNGGEGIPENQVEALNLEFDVEYGPEDGSALTTARQPLFAVLLPAAHAAKAQVFWRITGCGISSRLADDLIKNLDTMTVAREAEARKEFITSRSAEAVVRNRIGSFLDRAPIKPRSKYVQADDVFMFPAGMSAIYNCTKALKSWPGAQMVVFGFPYELTVKVQQDFSKACTFYGFGTTVELDQFEESLRVKSLKSPDEPPVQAVWCECASNPLLRTVDLDRIRRLADKYGFLVIIDDTIGSSANVDVMDIADVVITSLTKSFNGYADVLCGSIALNPAMPHYKNLKTVISASYTNYFYVADAVQLEINSRNYLERSTIMNRNASYLVSILEPLTRDHHPDSPLTHVYHPSTCWSAENYKARLRQSTDDFTPGHGFLFTLEFVNLKVATAFYDAIQVCKGPSIGAPITLALPYVQVVFQKEKQWAASYGLSEAIVRISVGLEDQMALAMAVLDAMRAADAAMEDTRLEKSTRQLTIAPAAVNTASVAPPVASV